MYIVSLIISVFSLGFCWFTYWSILFTLISLGISSYLFYKYFLSSKKDQYKKGKACVFASFLISIIAIIAAISVASMLLGISLMVRNG